MNTAAGIVERVRPEPAFYQHSRDHDRNERNVPGRGPDSDGSGDGRGSLPDKLCLLNQQPSKYCFHVGASFPPQLEPLVFCSVRHAIQPEEETSAVLCSPAAGRALIIFP